MSICIFCNTDLKYAMATDFEFIGRVDDPRIKEIAGNLDHIGTIETGIDHTRRLLSYGKNAPIAKHELEVRLQEFLLFRENWIVNGEHFINL